MASQELGKMEQQSFAKLIHIYTYIIIVLI
jgi:hypothetical protein